MINLNNQYLYAKGTCNVVVRDVATGDVEYQSNKVQTNQFTTSADMGAINAGIGNPVAIQIPHNSAVNMTLTSADFSMAMRAMQVGTSVAYNGVGPVCEVVTASNGALTVSKTPAAPYGYTRPICNVVKVGDTNASGMAYDMDAESKTVTGATVTDGQQYTVFYFASEASNQYFNVGGMFSPAVKHVTVQIAVYSAAGTSNALQGSKVGDLYYIIPRMQFSGKADIEGSQTAATTTDMSGTALTYDDASQLGACNDCAVPGLAQVLYVPAAGSTSDVTGLVVVGGVINMQVASTMQVPVKYVMKDGTLAQPDYTALQYTIPSEGQQYVTVDENGLLTSKSTAGETSISITMAEPALTLVADINVG